jgi:hypothetical protein
MGPHFFMVSFFSQKLACWYKLQWLFHSCLLKSHHVSWTSGWVLLLIPLSQGLSTLPDIFRKGIMEPTLPCVFYCPPAWSCPQVFNWVYFWGEDMWRKVWHRVVFMQNFWNFKAIPDTKIILILVQRKLVLKNSSDSYGLVSWSDIWFVKKGLNFNLRVIKNWIGSKHLFYLHEYWFDPHVRALPTDLDCLPLIRKGLIRYVM